MKREYLRYHMKGIQITVLILVLFSCKKADDRPEPLQVTSPMLVLLKVDYLTHQFEGGKVYTFPNSNTVIDSIPINVIYQNPTDFGHITLKYAPTSDTIFDGGIIWMGKGEIRYPVFEPVSAFSSGTWTSTPPDIATVQTIPADWRPFADSTIKQAWSGIERLHITGQMSASNAKTGLFLYMPSVGVGNPADWDFIWMLYIRPAN